MINAKDIYRSLRLKGKVDHPREDFLRSTAEFNRRIVEKMLEGYKFTIPKVGGILEAKAKERTKKSNKFTDVNWPESKKYKQELIDAGKIPYDKDKAPNGIKWFVYYEGAYCLWNWFRRTGDRYKKNIMYYSFKPTRGNSRKLSQAFRNNPIAEVTYDIHNKNS